MEANALRHGIILRFVGNRISFSPPLIITAPELEDVIGRVEALLDDTLSDLN
jgi:4-aminobutyrate--pyruvate transaminase